MAWTRVDVTWHARPRGSITRTHASADVVCKSDWADIACGPTGIVGSRKV